MICVALAAWHRELVLFFTIRLACGVLHAMLFKRITGSDNPVATGVRDGM
jgi:hypothetical protein